MFLQVTAEQYQATFDKALNLLETLHFSLDLDLYDLAHQATEAHFENPALDLQQLVLELFSCVTGWAEVQPKVEQTKAEEVVDESESDFAQAEVTLDLGSLYLQAAPFLELEDKVLFQKVWSAEDLTDAEEASLEDLGEKVRKVIHAQTGPQKYFYKHGGRGKVQVVYWQKIHQKKLSAVAKAVPSGNRRSRKRFVH